MVHPFLYTTLTGIPRPDDITELGHLGLTGPSIVSGLIAWFLLVVLAATAMFQPDRLHIRGLACEPRLRSDSDRGAFVIKEQGDFTSNIGQIAPGAVAYVDGPHGNLTLERRPVILVYGNRRQEQIIHLDELQAMSKSFDLRVAHVLTEPPSGWSGHIGMVDGVLVKELFSFDGADRWCYFLCGPPPMIDAAERALLEKGIPDWQIVSERFAYD